MNEITVASTHGKPTTTSLDISRHFGKRHSNVIRAVERLLQNIAEDAPETLEERRLNFELTFNEVTGPNGAARREPSYRITRDGFTLLAMGFTGRKALQFKLAYIDAFNKMERALQPKPPIDVLKWLDPSNIAYFGATGEVTMERKYFALLEATMIGNAYAAEKYNVPVALIRQLREDTTPEDLAMLGMTILRFNPVKAIAYALESDVKKQEQHETLKLQQAKAELNAAKRKLLALERRRAGAPHPD